MEGPRPGWAVKAIVVIIITSIFFRCVSAANHSVGGESGWDLSTNLQAWSAATTLRAGDYLVFKYLPLHDVLEVNQLDFAMCRTIRPISAHNDGKTAIHLSQPGTRYFICGRLRHCLMGLKLRVQVLEQSSDDDGSTDDGDQEHRFGPRLPPRPQPRHPAPRHPPPGSDEPPPSDHIPDEPKSPCSCSGARRLMATDLVSWLWQPFITLLVMAAAWSSGEVHSLFRLFC